MDFHSLSRRELQTICKRNKIPANMTNLAMADALTALEIVEGIEEFLEASQSETAQSSVDSPVKLEATSPYVPPTGGRTTRRRNAAKEESVNPMTRTRRTTRKTVVKDDNAIETPAVVGQTTTRKKNLMASACQKMDAKFNECVEEEKKDVSMTPAQLGVTSRRRGGAKEESVVKRVYSTRRSARLTEKTEMENGEPGLFKNDDENEKINSELSSDCLDEISGISGVDASTTMETENFEEDDASEVVSAQEQDISISNEKELGSNIEADGFGHEVKESSDVQIEEDASEVVSAEEEDISISNKNELVNNIEADGSDHEEQESRDVQIEEAAIAPVMEAELDNEKSDKIDDAKGENMIMPQNLGNEVQESDGPHYICVSEIEMSVGNADVQSLDEHNIEDAGYEDEAPADLENVILQEEDNVAVDELSCDVDIADETEQEMQIHKDMDSEDVSENVNEEVLQINAEMHVNVVEKELNVEPTDLVILDDKEENEMNLVKDTKLELQQANEEVKSDDVPAADLDLVDDLAKSSHLDKEKHGESETKAVVVQPTCLLPIKSSASEASATKRKITIVAVSDNKENIASGAKLVLTKERVTIVKNTTAKNVPKLDDLSMRQLTKMLKEKLQITNNSRETENGDEVALPAPARPALKALPENI